MLKLTATVQQTPPDHKGGYELATDSIVAEAEDYADAKSQAERSVPEGWRIIALRVERDTDTQ